MTKIRPVGLEVGGSDCKEALQNLRVTEVFYCGGDYKCVQHCQNSSKCTRKMGAYYCIKLYINKTLA